MKKTKMFVAFRNGDSRGEERGVTGFKVKEANDADATPLTTQKSSESHIVDVANKSMVNRY
jgi:hypothetical protein